MAVEHRAHNVGLDVAGHLHVETLRLKVGNDHGGVFLTELLPGLQVNTHRQFSGAELFSDRLGQSVQAVIGRKPDVEPVADVTSVDPALHGQWSYHGG